MILKVKLPTTMHSFEWLCLQISDAKYIFLSYPKVCDWGLIVAVVYYIQIWSKKEHNIIISWVSSSHMGPVYIKTDIEYRSLLKVIGIRWKHIWG